MKSIIIFSFTFNVIVLKECLFLGNKECLNEDYCCLLSINDEDMCLNKK